MNAQRPCDPSKKLDFYFYERSYNGDFGRTSDLTGNYNYTTANGEDSNHFATVFNVKDIRPGQ